MALATCARVIGTANSFGVLIPLLEINAEQVTLWLIMAGGLVASGPKQLRVQIGVTAAHLT